MPQNLLKYPYDVRDHSRLVRAFETFFDAFQWKKDDITEFLLQGLRDEEKNGRDSSLSQPNQASKRSVKIKVIILQLGEVHTLLSTFTAEVIIQVTWNKEQEDPNSDEDPWSPELLLENLISYMGMRRTQWCFCENGVMKITEQRRMFAKFSQQMYLRDFPADTQWITIAISTNHSGDEIELIPDLEGSKVLSYREKQEWNVHRKMCVSRKLVGRNMGDTTNMRPVVHFGARVSRQIGFYLWNIIVVMAMIVMLGFASFTLDISITERRLEVTSVLALTAVQFKVNVSKHVPRLAYLTVLDKYIISSMIFLILIGVSHAILLTVVRYASTSRTGYSADALKMGANIQAYVVTAFAGVFAIMQLSLIIWFYLKLRLRDKLDEDESSQMD